MQLAVPLNAVDTEVASVGATLALLSAIGIAYGVRTYRANISRARKTSPAGKVRDCAPWINSWRCSLVRSDTR